MTSNEIKHITALHVDKYRRQQQSFLAEGPKILEEVLKSDFVVKAIYALPEWIALNTVAENIPLFAVSEKELARISQLKTPNQVVAEIAMKKQKKWRQSEENEWIIAMDNINNPGNLGTIIRTADWFGIRKIVCSQNCADFYNPKVIQATMGSFTRVNMFYTDLKLWLQQEVQHTPVYGALMDGISLYDVHLPKRGILLIGNESKGISSELRPMIVHPVKIPDHSSKAESLNASIATAIILSEIRRPK